ncbi:type IX secretion/gliding motility protein PorT/SprT [Sediminitomix flava]|uniref:type IX secretion/gliding motility protein PorT/SprT n=1 Tax=Sediminitomix flava TaxID=379075 RepID=UPI001304FAAA|nr:outer membrane beta-barrel protein [Sediminitomix flava]
MTFCFQSVLAQSGLTIFRPKYDERKLHYGFHVGFFNESTNVKFVDDFLSNTLVTEDSLNGIQGKGNAGFSVGFILNYKLQDQWDLRFLPGVSLFERLISYNYPNQVIESSVQNTEINLPILIRYKSKRRRNHRVYIIGGLTPNFQVSTKTDDPPSESFEYKSFNLEATYGIGVDMYMQMFNFVPELRISHGLLNIHKQNDKNPVTDLVDRIYTHKISFILNFEG